MNSSENLNELATALAKAQAVMGGALKDANNPFYKSAYADLESVWKACRKALTDNGISVVQYGAGTDYDKGVPILITRLLHSSGQWIEGYFQIKSKDDSPQAMGSGIAYARRYGLGAMVGVYATDDDGEAAQGRHTAPQRDFSPRPDGTDDADPVKVRKYAKAFRDALADRNDERVLRGHDDLNADPALYTAVNDALEPKERTAIAEAITRARQERAKIKQAF